MSGETPAKESLKRWEALKQERASWVSHWEDLSKYIKPRNGRFFVQDRNRGDKRHNSIYDNTATRALSILGAGMMSGANSPARPWFRLGTSDPELTDYAPVKLWLSDVTKVLLRIFAKSNTYRSLHTVYEELGVFGTGVSVIVDDFNTVLHHHTLTAGEYAIATGFDGAVNTVYREFEITVGQMVKEFGYDNCSTQVKNAYDRCNEDQWFPVMHIIEERDEDDREYGKKDNRNMPWKSCYFEPTEARSGKYLKESGFKRFPALAPRWQVSGGDIYGSSPAMDALGDIKQLQHQQLRKGQVIDYKTKPALQVPTMMQNREMSQLPGGVSYVDVAAAGQGIRPAWEVNLDLSHLLTDIQDVRDRVRSAFYADLFMMIANDTRSNVTATEIAERHEEKLLMLGPVLERLHNELLDPLVETAFSKALEAGILPPPPPELQGQDLNVEFVSMLAQAQKAVATNAVDRFVGNLGAIAQFRPDVLDKFNADEWADAYADMLGVDPALIVADDKVALVRQSRAQQQQAMQQQEAQAMQAKSMRDLSAADTSKESALTDVASMFSGYTGPGTGLQ